MHFQPLLYYISYILNLYNYTISLYYSKSVTVCSILFIKIINYIYVYQIIYVILKPLYLCAKLNIFVQSFTSISNIAFKSKIILLYQIICLCIYTGVFFLSIFNCLQLSLQLYYTSIQPLISISYPSHLYPIVCICITINMINTLYSILLFLMITYTILMSITVIILLI